jgi:hypothetical protein
MERIEEPWRKSSRSGEQGDMCVELAVVADIVAIRDSKAPDGPKLLLSRRAFSRFADALKNA